MLSCKRFLPYENAKRTRMHAMMAMSESHTQRGSSAAMPRASSCTCASIHAASMTGAAVAHVMRNEQTHPR